MRETDYFTVGNTAKSLDAYNETNSPVKQKEYFKEIPDRYQQEKRNIQYDSFNLPYVIVLSVAMIATLVICVQYLQLQSNMTARIRNISKLEAQLEIIKNENDNLEKRINTSVDLDYVYKVATEELGMVYAKKNQVRMFEKTERGYVRQTEDIPDEVKEKVAMFCNVNKNSVILAKDEKILYQVTVNLLNQHADDLVCKHFHLDLPEADMSEWYDLIEKVDNEYVLKFILFNESSFDISNWTVVFESNYSIEQQEGFEIIEQNQIKHIRCLDDKKIFGARNLSHLK